MRLAVGGRDVTGEPRLLVDGALDEAESGRTFPVVDPSTAREIGVAADGSAGDMERAIDAAERSLAVTSWATDSDLRARCLRQLQQAMRDDAETLRRDLVAEIGCAVRMTYGDQLDRPIEKLGFYADLAERYAYTTRLDGGDGPLGAFLVPRAGRGRRRDHPVEHPGRALAREGRRGARGGLLGRPQALAALALVGDAPRAARRGADRDPARRASTSSRRPPPRSPRC